MGTNMPPGDKKDEYLALLTEFEKLVLDANDTQLPRHAQLPVSKRLNEVRAKLQVSFAPQHDKDYRGGPVYTGTPAPLSAEGRISDRCQHCPWPKDGCIFPKCGDVVAPSSERDTLPDDAELLKQADQMQEALKADMAAGTRPAAEIQTRELIVLFAEIAGRSAMYDTKAMHDRYWEIRRELEGRVLSDSILPSAKSATLSTVDAGTAARFLRDYAAGRQRTAGMWTGAQQRAIDIAIKLEQIARTEGTGS